MNDQEREVKFFVRNLPRLETRLKEMAAALVQARIHEVNLRFDTPQRTLSENLQVLRLRQDTAARLTYKGPSRSEEGVRARQEIEFTVGDFDAAQSFLKALGYEVSLMYEKYRAVYDIDQVHVTLDELPYGDFVEIEGPDPEAIREASRRLDLDWEARIQESYTGLFEFVKQELGLSFRDLSFENFQDISVTPSDLKVAPADR